MFTTWSSYIVETDISTESIKGCSTYSGAWDTCLRKRIKSFMFSWFNWAAWYTWYKTVLSMSCTSFKFIISINIHIKTKMAIRNLCNEYTQMLVTYFTYQYFQDYYCHRTNLFLNNIAQSIWTRHLKAFYYLDLDIILTSDMWTRVLDLEGDLEEKNIMSSKPHYDLFYLVPYPFIWVKLNNSFISKISYM